MIISVAYLSEVMEKGTSVDELIRSFPPGAESCYKALKQLQARYEKLETPPTKDVTKKRASKESSDDDFKSKPKKEFAAKAKKTAAPRKKTATKEGGAAVNKPSKPKVKSKNKLCSDDDFSLSDNDVPSSQPPRQPRSGWWERSIGIRKNLPRIVLGGACVLRTRRLRIFFVTTSLSLTLGL
ncbi:hypothetical protein AVEN_2894-1 [Araneus ventricosus]|uniref:Uncharacterized protein n=1 Tax=Araneus ventricosus TaxID=182803 RepID=A0A4Y2N701_ARAVE|nr:hypothetical protein AVEN_2894-1 [Araneus ventricosus]